MGEVIHVNQDDFQQEVLEAEVPVLVDFTAVWCGPCKMLDPVVDDIAKDINGQLKIVKLDVDHNPDVAMQFSVMGVPTLMLFVDGQEVHRMVGFKPKKHIMRKISDYLP